MVSRNLAPAESVLPSRFKKFEWHFNDLIWLQEFLLEEAVAKPGPSYVFSQTNR